MDAHRHAAQMVRAMTKADIAAELAHRDIEIERLRAACLSAITWLEGWASAEPYLMILRNAVKTMSNAEIQERRSEEAWQDHGPALPATVVLLDEVRKWRAAYENMRAFAEQSGLDTTCYGPHAGPTTSTKPATTSMTHAS